MLYNKDRVNVVSLKYHQLVVVENARSSTIGQIPTFFRIEN